MTEFTKRPRVPQVLPKQCVACSSTTEYQCVSTKGPIPIKGESFEIEYECMECPACHHRILSNEQLDNRIRRTVEAYQKAHGLLTSREVVTRRKAIGLKTQQDFVAAAPAVSMATLKRLEAGQHVQDPTSDFVLRKEFEQLEQNHEQSMLFAMLVGYQQRTVIYRSDWLTFSWGSLPSNDAIPQFANRFSRMAYTNNGIVRRERTALSERCAEPMGEPAPC